MRAMVLSKIVSHLGRGDRPLKEVNRDCPVPGRGEILIRVTACGVCHTELDEIEGRTPPLRFPIVPGHEVVGRVQHLGEGATRFVRGQRVGVGWIYSSSGGKAENLDPAFRATGRDAHGGYAEFMVVPEASAHPIPDVFSDIEAAPLLCAGAVGYRALKLTGLKDGQALGLTGFGGSAHLVLQMCRYRFPRSSVSVFARDEAAREFALELGATWVGATEDRSPHGLDAVIDTTPAWKPVVEALANLRPGGRLVINAIRKEESDKSELLKLDYARHLWMEKEIKTVANVTSSDIAEFLPLAAAVPLKPEVQTYALADANQALSDLKYGGVRGAKVLVV